MSNPKDPGGSTPDRKRTRKESTNLDDSPLRPSPSSKQRAGANPITSSPSRQSRQSTPGLPNLRGPIRGMGQWQQPSFVNPHDRARSASVAAIGREVEAIQLNEARGTRLESAGARGQSVIPATQPKKSTTQHIAWPDRMKQGDATIGAFYVRTRFPVQPYPEEVVLMRPGYYDTTNNMEHVRSVFHTHFPNLPTRSTWDNGKIFGQDLRSLYCELYNLEGHILRQD